MLVPLLVCCFPFRGRGSAEPPVDLEGGRLCPRGRRECKLLLDLESSSGDLLGVQVDQRGSNGGIENFRTIQPKAGMSALTSY